MPTIENARTAVLARQAWLDTQAAAVKLCLFEGWLKAGCEPEQRLVDEARQHLWNAEQRIQEIYERLGVEV